MSASEESDRAIFEKLSTVVILMHHQTNMASMNLLTRAVLNRYSSKEPLYTDFDDSEYMNSIANSPI